MEMRARCTRLNTQKFGFPPPLLIQIAIFGSKEEQCVSMLDHVLFVYAYFQLEQDLCRD